MNDQDLDLIFTAEISDRIDKVIASSLEEVTRAKAQNLIKENRVFVNSKPVSKNYTVKIGDEISVSFPPLKELEINAENIPLDIVFEDEDVIVVNKPKGMVVHPAPGNYCGTLVNALMYHAKGSLSGINGVIRPGIVHRIDKDTSGLLIVAKNDFAHNILAQQIKVHSFKREYHALVYGNVKTESGKIDMPIARNPKDRKKMAVSNLEGARNAITHYSVIERLKGFTYIELRLETGRTHQIRVHMAALAHPVAGDSVYGPKKVITELKGQCLHAKTIGFIHPRSGEYLEFSTPLPEYFTKYMGKLS